VGKSTMSVTSFRLAAAIVSVFITSAGAGPVTPPQAARTVIALHCGHLIDTQASKLLGETTIAVESKRIRNVVAGHQMRKGATEIAATE
jgi:ribosomal protein S17E